MTRRNILAIVKEIHHEARKDDVPTYAAALAYHVMLALFPFLFVLIAVTASLNIGGLVNQLLSWSRLVLPIQAFEQITNVLEGLRRGDSPALISLGALAAVWAASGGVRSAMTALNRAYRVAEPRTTVKRYLVSLGYTVALAALVLIIAALLFVGPEAIGLLERLMGLGGVLTFVWSWLRYPLILGLLVVAAALAYSLLPNGVPFRWVSSGSLVAVTLWLATSFSLRLYLANFGRFNLVYGSIGAVIILLIYIYLCALALLIGGEVNAVLGRRRQSE